MVEAQVANATGVKYLVARQKKGGKFVHLTEALAKAIIAGEDTDHEMLDVWEKLPNVQAFTDLMNRTLGKPAEHVEAEVNTKGELVFRWAGKS